MKGEPDLYDPETDMLLVKLRPWPSQPSAEVNELVGGGLPHAYEVEHASARPDLVAPALAALRTAKGYAASCVGDGVRG